MAKSFKDVIEGKKDLGGFIKTSDAPLSALDSSQKVQLNRRGNMLLNEGHFEEAKRIFMTTGYSDGLTRVADRYMDKKEELNALKFYLLAHNKKRSEELIEKLSSLVSQVMNEGQNEQ